MDEIRREIQALGSDDRTIRDAALIRIAKLTGKKIGDALFKETESPNQFLKRSATIALGNRGDIRAISGLVHYLEDDDQELALSALNSLAIINDPKVLNPMIIALGNNHREIRKRASELLKTRGINFGDTFVEALEKKRTAADILIHLEDYRIIAPLLKARISKNIELRWVSHEILSRLGDFAIEPFIDALSSKNSKVRWEVAGYLGKLGDMRALKPITALLADENAEVKSAAVTALGALGHPDSYDHIIKSLNNPQTTEAAVEALGLFGGEPAFEKLMQLLQSSDPKIRAAVLKTLGQMGETRCLEKLFEMEKNEKTPAAKTPIQNTIDQIILSNKSLEENVNQMRCSHCFSKFAGFIHKQSLFKKYTFYACSECKSSVGSYGLDEVIAVLDRQMEESAVREGGTLSVNWFSYERAFEFDELKILDASNDDIKEFLKIAVENCNLSAFKKKMKSIQVSFGPGLELSEETMNTLKKHFKVD
jgi:HEAT repeat protein